MAGGESKFARLPVVVLSGATDPAETRKVLDLGAKAYLAKPASFEGWKSVFQTVWNAERTHKQTRPNPTSSAPRRPRRILAPRKLSAR
jgi:DNA-binding NarL/FixJ family response regulator